MRILFVSNLYPPYHIGGYEMVCQRTADALRERGHQLRVLTSTFQSGRREDKSVVRVLTCPYQLPDSIRDANDRESDHNAKALLIEIEKFQPDVIGLWNLHGLGMQTLYQTALQTGVPVATRLGDYQFWPNWDRHQPIDPGLLKILRDPRIRCAANCRTLGNDLANAGIPPKTIAVLHAHLESTRVELPAPPPKPPPIRLLWAGRIAKEKGLPVAVEAAIILAHRHGIPANLDIAGDGDNSIILDCMAKLQQAKISGVQNLDVKYLGRVSHSQMHQILPKYHVYLAPSIGHETFPMTCIEAMEAGVLVVASRLGGLLEITGGGRFGLLFDPGDTNDLARQLQRLVTDHKLVQKLRIDARQHALRHFSRENSINRFEAFITECARGLSVDTMSHLVPKMSDPTDYERRIDYSFRKVCARLINGLR